MRDSTITGRLCILAGVAAMVLASWQYASASPMKIIGSLSNFDVYNHTGDACDGFEIECEGVSVSNIASIYNPWGYNVTKTQVGNSVIVKYDGLGSQVSVSDGELKHYGVHFSGGVSPTKVIYNWLANDGRGNLVHAPVIPTPAALTPTLPTPVWISTGTSLGSGIHNGNNVPIWVKKNVASNSRALNLEDLLVTSPLFEDNQEPPEAFLLDPGDTLSEPEDLLAGGAVGGRAEFWIYSYTGPLDDSGNAAISDPPFETYHGPTLGTVMVAVNLAIPEPGTLPLLSGLCGLVLLRRRHRTC